MLAFFRFIKFYNEGEITMVSVRKRGKVYEYRFEIATVEGTRKWITKSGYPTKAEAFKEGAKAYNNFYYNGQKTQLRENMSYADFLDYWIDNYASFNLYYSTTISYINIIKNHVKPRVGFYKLWQLDTRLLQEFINKIYVEYGFSKNYMASILKVVKGSSKYACYTLNYINTNPAEHVHAPRIDKIGKDPAHIFTQEEIERILDRFKGTHSIYYAFLTAYYTGMRVSEVKDEMVTEQGTNTDEMPKQVQKKVLHIKINTKTLEQIKNDYHFSSAQNKQLAELTDNKYASLWNGVIYGATDSGEYVNWRQAGQSWSNIKIDNTNSTIGNIGCLVTSIAILIEKSGVPTPNIEPFNPGTFVEKLNKNGGFDERGNLYYGPISKVVPNFKYVGNVNLRGKSRNEKLALITQYVNAGYFVTEEVKGATPGNQHWVAVTGVNGNNIIMVDPASNQTDMWSAYEWSKSSQFNYFKAE